MTKQQESNLILIKVAGWTFAVGGMPDEEERVRDIDLAERLEYREPRQIRRLIKSMIERGELIDVLCRTVPVQQRTGRGGAQTDVFEYWLTEGQALKVSARSGTHIANKILDHIIKVFLAVRDEYRTKAQVAAAPTHPMFMSDTQAQAELLKARRAYHEDAMLHIVDLEATGKITRETAMAHRTHLLQEAGIDLTKAPMIVYENVPMTTTESFGGVPVTKGTPIEGRPVVGVHVKPVVDLTGFHSAQSIADIFEGVSSTLVNRLARGVGIFEKKTDILNEFGCHDGIDKNGSEINKNWLHSGKSKAILLPLVQQFLDIRRSIPKRRVVQGPIIDKVCADWLAGQAPASPPTPVQH